MKIKRLIHKTGFAVVSANPENATSGTWYLDMVHDRLYLSDETFRIFGISKDSFLPYYETFFNDILHPDDRTHWSYNWGQLIKSTIPLNIEHRIVLSTGEIRCVRQRVAWVVDISGRLKWLKGIVEASHRTSLLPS